MDNVITKKNPNFVGFANYAEILTSEVFHTAILNTLFFTIVSVLAHLVLGLAFAMLLNTRLLSNGVKAFFRVLYVLPWLFTVAIIAMLWRLLLNPNGVVNYILSTIGLIDSNVEWLSTPETALYRRDLHQHLVRLSLLHDQPAGRTAGHSARAVRGRHG